ncbi:protein-glutamine gamma-glutamyltransferase [Paenibacillus crassostreae]|uniref:Protein-glutamine gamma-glutamyltransferase n=1 Tax=Paenibacillus crassostreae TaxID=1763538 RepID=A0A167GB17_9BACL|nr:protein-glutamine gamma-glutamyltransferase [Paenibacillus crassostreae]AOZ92633.1 protein-glutamine gamma-glutamyltransferase [Paenibacillus crassostreae]OAB77400.1 protein-glutamine gamma-glutamyltransferase [Paenibacillus crassostreae]
MILIPGYDVEQIISTLQLSNLEKDIVQLKNNSHLIYRYDSLASLAFELTMRTAIVEAAYALDKSDVSFAVFRQSRCNTQLWTRTENGGFRLNHGIPPADGINDIFENGKLYAFECATAMVIILYRATLNVIQKDSFNKYFEDLYLRDWKYDSDLRLLITNHNNEAYPGDIVYFKNPEHALETPEWQGENAVLLANDLYFGHGLGIRTSEQIIAALNRRRIPWSNKSAYLSNEVLHPDFDDVRKMSTRGNHKVEGNIVINSGIAAKIGSQKYYSKMKA